MTGYPQRVRGWIRKWTHGSVVRQPKGYKWNEKDILSWTIKRLTLGDLLLICYRRTRLCVRNCHTMGNVVRSHRVFTLSCLAFSRLFFLTISATRKHLPFYYVFFRRSSNGTCKFASCYVDRAKCSRTSHSCLSLSSTHSPDIKGKIKGINEKQRGKERNA